MIRSQNSDVTFSAVVRKTLLCQSLTCQVRLRRRTVGALDLRETCGRRITIIEQQTIKGGEEFQLKRAAARDLAAGKLGAASAVRKDTLLCRQSRIHIKLTNPLLRQNLRGKFVEFSVLNETRKLLT
ncbi:unnamed protein product [Parnassius apollo]|uniref:(apollo) hypothetical protein n=1 Tax=Parnassius apollo TaxID=110799 RepID=A0A8S3XGB6_PARAO|nr:unnamed protein product [Parnassius apollo]